MKSFKMIFGLSLFYTVFTYCSATNLATVSSYQRIELSFEHWAEMSSLAITYTNALNSFKEGDDVEFETILDEMKSLASRLPSENNAQQNYLFLIESRRKEIEELKKLNIE